MANSEANLSSDFDIDEVINWDEQNYSSKSIEYQLPQLGLANDAKTSQNTTVTNLVTSQQASLQGAQNTGSFYSSFFGAANNPSVVQNSKNHGFATRQPMVSPNALSFPSENINIPSLATSNSSLLQFTPNMVGQNTSLTSQLCVPSMQNSSNIINDDVSPFDDSADLIEGPLDKIVDQIMERQISERESSSFDDDTPVITYSNRQAKVPQLASTMSPNAPSRNVTSPNVSSPNVPMRSIPSPNAPTHQVPSPGNPSQNILSPNPQSRNILVQNITTNKIIPPSISQPNIPSPNTASQSGLQHSTAHVFSTIQGLNSQSSEKSISSQSHPKFRQSSVVVPSSMVNTLGHTTTKDPPPTGLSFGQGDLTTNGLFQSSPGQRNGQSYPSFLLQNSNQTLIQQPSVTSFSQNNQPSKSSWPQTGNNLDDLLRMQESIRASSSNVEQAEFANQLARSSPNFTTVLTNKIVTEQSQNNLPSFITTNISSGRPSTLFSDVNDITGDSHLKISAVSSTITSNLNIAGAQNLNPEILQYTNRTTESSLKSVSNQAKTTYSVQMCRNFPSNIVSSPLPSGQNQQRGVLVATRPLSSPRQQTSTSGNQFFVQNPSDLNQSSEMNRSDSLFSNVSQPQSAASNNPSKQGKPSITVVETPSHSEQDKALFTLVPPANTTQVISTPQSTLPTFFQSQANPITKPAGITTIKIASPAANAAGFRFPTVGFTPNTAPKAVSMQPPRAVTVRLKSPANSTSSAFPTFRLSQANMVTSTNSPSTKPMVFTLAPGPQSGLTGLPAKIKDKLVGRQLQIFLQQPSGQPINTPKPQPMKIVFVNDGSIGQLVSGPVKTKVSQVAPVSTSQTPGLTVASKMTPSTTDGKPSPATLAEYGQDEGSPSSVYSADSDVIPIASLKHDESFNKQLHETNDAVEHKRRGKKRRKDPNRPVKPLSSFQRFFQATQPTLRQQNPQATFAAVSKTIKEMWENLSSKEKKVYQDAWRLERVQYKRALEDYNASFDEIDSVDAPSPKLIKSEPKDDLSPANPIPVPPVDIRIKTENISIKTENLSILTPCGSTPPATTTSTMPAPRSTGKPLAMMAEMANKTKMASAQAAAATKAMGMTKSLHSAKNKASNGVDDSSVHLAKKKAKINPIPKKLCIRSHCNNPAKTTKERGTMFCSDDCIMRYCRGVFKSWVEARRQTLKTAT